MSFPSKNWSLKSRLAIQQSLNFVFLPNKFIFLQRLCKTAKQVCKVGTSNDYPVYEYLLLFKILMFCLAVIGK